MTAPAPNPERFPPKPGSIPGGAVARRARGSPGWNVKALAFAGAAVAAGIVIIGFILRNLDNRAREIEKRHNLPWGIDANNRGVQRAEAVKSCTEALAIRPNDPTALELRGRAHTGAGDDAAAARDFESAKKYAPSPENH